MEELGFPWGSWLPVVEPTQQRAQAHAESPRQPPWEHGRTGLYAHAHHGGARIDGDGRGGDHGDRGGVLGHEQCLLE